MVAGLKLSDINQSDRSSGHQGGVQYMAPENKFDCSHYEAGGCLNIIMRRTTSSQNQGTST